MITYHNPIKHTLRVDKDNCMSTHQALPEDIEDFQSFFQKENKMYVTMFDLMWLIYSANIC